MNFIAVFMAKRILSGKENYEEIVTLRPDLKDDIDKYLQENQ